MKGDGNFVGFESRAFDPRVGVFLSLDPQRDRYPYNSPYLFAVNNPIRFIDINGEGPGDGILDKIKLIGATLILITDRDIFRIQAERFSNTMAGKAVGKTATQVYASALGLINGTNSLLSFGSYNVPFENLHLSEEYRGWYEKASLVGRSQPFPEGGVGNSGISPGLALATNSEVAVIKQVSNAQAIQRVTTVLSAANNLKGPNRTRHDAARVRQKSLTKEANTVADQSVDFDADVAAINAGQAKKVGNEYQINNRIYGEHDGTLFPISGDGLYKLDRGEYKALGVLNEFGITDKSRMILDRMQMSNETVNKAMEVYNKIHPQTN